MGELDDNIAEIYRSTNAEMKNLLRDSHEKLYKNNIILAIMCVVLSVSVIVLSVLNYWNNQKWLEVFNSYEYVSEEVTYEQDGNGVNSWNAGTMGDIINGTDDSN